MASVVKERHEIPIEHTWDLTNIFSSRIEWEEEFERTEKRLLGLSDFKGQLGSSPQKLLEWFDTSDDVLISVGKIIVYSSLNYSVDTANQEAIAMNDRGRGLMARASGAVSFDDPELLEIGSEKLNKWMEEEPKLQVYKKYFDALESQRPHRRSAEVEQLLSELGDPFGTAAAIHGTMSDADLTFTRAEGTNGSEPIEIIQGNIWKLLSHADREVRRTAWENYADQYLAHQNSMATCISTGMKQDVFNMRARKYNSSLEASLKPNNIPLEVFHNLIDTFKKNLPTWHKYWRIRKKAMGLDALHVYDTKAPLSNETFEISFDQSMEWICEGMKPLGEQYVSDMKRGVYEQRWVDIYPNKGKRAGAFSSGSSGTYPYIMMSYGDDILGLSTLAHELGHSMHSYYTRNSQPFVYSRYTMFVAEVASNFNQALVRDYLVKNNPDPNFQIAVIEEAMANYHRYFLIMPTLARFELEIHERIERGEALSAASLNKLMADLFRETYGDEVVMDDDRVGSTWAQFPTHLYSNFYVFQYATGIAGANALANRVMNEGESAAKDYLAFLNAGNSLYPIDALKMAGVDLSTPGPVEEAFSVLGDYVDRLGELLGVS
jgi:oligoendopeptidase F